MVTSANILAIIVTIAGCFIAVKLFRICFYHHTCIPEDDDMAKDLLFKRRAMADGENVYAEGNDRAMWLKQAKAYLKQSDK